MMKLTHNEKMKKKYSKPVIYKIDPNDPRIPQLQTLFEQPKKIKKFMIDEPHPKK